MAARVLPIFLIYWLCVSITHADVVLDANYKEHKIRLAGIDGAIEI